ncbi:MAG: DNA polymerase III subunit beta [Thermodesulfobacteriota bacterium]
MKFSIEKQKLLEKLMMVQGIAERRATMPILSHVLINCTDNILKITATDLETTLTTWTEAKIEEESSIAVPARKLFEIIRELSDGPVQFEEIKNNWINLSTSSGNYKIAGLPGDDFPIVPEVATNDLFSIDSSLLDDLISKTIYCVSSDDLRRNLSGIYFEKNGQNNLRLVATDGHRLSLVENILPSDIRLSSNVLVPRKAVSELRKILKQGETVQIGSEKNFFITLGEDLILFSRLIDADFPDYKQVIPEISEYQLKLDKNVFLSALKRVCIFSSEKTKSVKITFEKNIMALASVSPEVGEARESFEISYDGEVKEIGFNGNYLIDALEAIDEDDVIFSFSDELSPTQLKPENKDNYICVVMPMRI